MMKKIGITAAFCVATVLCLLGVNRLLSPKYMTSLYEGRLIGEYYQETTPHDVLIIGDCEVYENISPITLWADYGITSYIRGSAQQLIWQSYYLLEETLRYEKPKVVIFNVLAMKYDEPQNEAYNRLTLDGMRFSMSKVRSVLASMTAEESAITYFLPILRYHDRWRELNVDDFRYFLGGGQVSHNGFMMRSDVKPAGFVPTGPKLASYQFGANSYKYLDKMTALCAENDIPLVLIKAPSLYPYWYDEWDAQMAEYADNHGLLYINCLDRIDDIGLDFETDTYNGGFHLNLSGAEKLARYLGGILQDNFALTDWRGVAPYDSVWAAKKAAYDRMAAAQQKDIAELGKVNTFTY